MSIYFLKDAYQSELISKVNNFSIQTMKYHRFSRIVPFDMQFSINDLVIYNVNQGNPFSKFTLNNNNKKVAIVHRINRSNLQYINQADFVVYMNPIIEKIAKEKAHISIPSFTIPRYPLYNNNVSFNRDPFVFIGGNITDNILKNMNQEILSLHKRLDKKLEFLFFPVFGNVPSRTETFNKNIELLQKEIKNRVLFVMPNEMPVDLMLFRCQTAEYSYLWNKGINIEQMNDLLSSSGDEILNFDIYESAMLSAVNGSNIICGNYSPYIGKSINNYHFTDLSSDLSKIITNL